MKWSNQVSRVNSLTVNFNGAALAGWSLPATAVALSSWTLSPDPGSPQMACLYYADLVHRAGNANGGLKNWGPFQSLVASTKDMWSG